MKHLQASGRRGIPSARSGVFRIHVVDEGPTGLLPTTDLMHLIVAHLVEPAKQHHLAERIDEHPPLANLAEPIASEVARRGRGRAGRHGIGQLGAALEATSVLRDECGEVERVVAASGAIADPVTSVISVDYCRTRTRGTPECSKSESADERPPVHHWITSL